MVEDEKAIVTPQGIFEDRGTKPKVWMSSCEFRMALNPTIQGCDRGALLRPKLWSPTLRYLGGLGPIANPPPLWADTRRPTWLLDGGL